jgi:hypothetical protein
MSNDLTGAHYNMQGFSQPTKLPPSFFAGVDDEMN